MNGIINGIKQNNGTVSNVLPSPINDGYLYINDDNNSIPLTIITTNIQENTVMNLTIYDLNHGTNQSMTTTGISQTVNVSVTGETPANTILSASNLQSLVNDRKYKIQIQIDNYEIFYSEILTVDRTSHVGTILLSWGSHLNATDPYDVNTRKVTINILHMSFIGVTITIQLWKLDQDENQVNLVYGSNGIYFNNNAGNGAGEQYHMHIPEEHLTDLEHGSKYRIIVSSRYGDMVCTTVWGGTECSFNYYTEYNQSIVFEVDKLANIGTITNDWGSILTKAESETPGGRVVTIPTTNIDTGQIVTLTLTGQDHTSTYQDTINTSGVSNITIPKSVLENLEDGAYVIKATVTDIAGNIAIKEINFAVNTSVPSINSMNFWDSTLNINEACVLNLKKIDVTNKTKTELNNLGLNQITGFFKTTVTLNKLNDIINGTKENLIKKGLNIEQGTEPENIDYTEPTHFYENGSWKKISVWSVGTKDITALAWSLDSSITEPLSNSYQLMIRNKTGFPTHYKKQGETTWTNWNGIDENESILLTGVNWGDYQFLNVNTKMITLHTVDAIGLQVILAFNNKQYYGTVVNDVYYNGTNQQGANIMISTIDLQNLSNGNTYNMEANIMNDQGYNVSINRSFIVDFNIPSIDAITHARMSWGESLNSVDMLKDEGHSVVVKTNGTEDNNQVTLIFNNIYHYSVVSVIKLGKADLTSKLRTRWWYEQVFNITSNHTFDDLFGVGTQNNMMLPDELLNNGTVTSIEMRVSTSVINDNNNGIILPNIYNESYKYVSFIYNSKHFKLMVKPGIASIDIPKSTMESLDLTNKQEGCYYNLNVKVSNSSGNEMQRLSSQILIDINKPIISTIIVPKTGNKLELVYNEKITSNLPLDVNNFIISRENGQLNVKSLSINDKTVTLIFDQFVTNNEILTITYDGIMVLQDVAGNIADGFNNLNITNNSLVDDNCKIFGVVHRNLIN